MKQVIGCYKINLKKKINEGRQASIYECTNTDSNTLCCVRVINKRDQNGQLNQEQYDQELKVLQQLKWTRHNNILAIHDYKEEANYIYQFCDLCDQTLHDYMKGKKIQRLDFLQFIEQISSGYIKLKQKKIIHRDLKPDNILIKKQGDEIQYKIADFGISKVIENEQRMNTKMIGTQQYSSPEKLQTTNYSYQSDIFSLGIILFEFTTGTLDLLNTQKKQKGFFEALKNQSFKQYINNQIDYEIQEQVLDILDKLIVYDPQKRMNWEDLNLLVTNQIKEYKQFLQPISDHRVRGAVSLYQNSSETDLQYVQNLSENQNLENLKHSQIRFNPICGQFNNLQQQNFCQFFEQDGFKQQVEIKVGQQFGQFIPRQKNQQENNFRYHLNYQSQQNNNKN